MYKFNNCVLNALIKFSTAIDRGGILSSGHKTPLAVTFFKFGHLFYVAHLYY